MIDKQKLTPMLQQYMEIKENTNDALVFYRLGDFYELFFEDAITASKALDLVLTARSAGKDQKAPMCGVPHHAAKSYIQKLIAKGFKVAIVEQVEDPKEAKGIVRREVIEIVTPGTYIEYEENQTHEIAAVHTDLVYATIVSADIASGSVRAIRVMNEKLEIIKTLQQFQVSELVVSTDISPVLINDIKEKTTIYVSYEDSINKTVKHSDYSIEQALQRLYAYLLTTQKKNLTHLGEVVVLNDMAYLRMDYASITNLELVQHGTSKDLSLYSFMNRTSTNMGARLLKEELMQPKVDRSAILGRQEEIKWFMDNRFIAEEIKKLLKETYDVHRVIARISTDKNNAQDFVRLKQTLNTMKQIQTVLASVERYKFVLECDSLEPVYTTLDATVYDDAPVQMKEGRTFKPGVDGELDELIAITKNGKQWLLKYEEEQREKTQIKNLKVGYTRAFGYYIEITRGQVENVSDDFGYIRKQTLTNAERYISAELQDYEVKVLQASDRIAEIELRLFKKYSAYIADFGQDIHKIGDVLARLDVILSMVEISSYPGYICPEFVESNDLTLVAGRHPVLEAELKNHQYIASDAVFSQAGMLQILTGPNMGGKSTFMRMVALNVIMAQMGCFVPAQKAMLPIVDQIFTRMGASDDILMGQSTFMIEMLEAQTALSRATAQSLVLFDEIGRGTSTYDGMALAQAILEYLVHTIGCKTLFSTHYHELTMLESMHEGIKNIHVEVHEEDDHVTFLYRVIEGKADKSYGINVARLAHLPQTILERAKENLIALETNKNHGNADVQAVSVIEVDPPGYVQVRDLMKRVDVNQTTPLEALTVLSEVKKIMGE